MMLLVTFQNPHNLPKTHRITHHANLPCLVVGLFFDLVHEGKKKKSTGVAGIKDHVGRRGEERVR